MDQQASLVKKFSKNVDKDSRCFELRFYTADPAVNGKGGVDDLHRFRKANQAVGGTWS